MRAYREKILPIIKAKYSGQDVDFIYQVLIEGNQYRTTHDFFKREGATKGSTGSEQFTLILSD
jgi:hypothetical protein